MFNYLDVTTIADGEQLNNRVKTISGILRENGYPSNFNRIRSGGPFLPHFFSRVIETVTFSLITPRGLDKGTRTELNPYCTVY
jgi:hypothetical protein